MKILIRNSDSVVIYAEPALALGAEGTHGDGWLSPLFTSSNAHLDDAELPAGWRGGVWSYTNGEWAVHDVAAYDALAQTALAEARATRHAAIRAERDRRKFDGVFVSGKWIHTDTYSRTQWMGMVMMGASVPAIPWTTMDGTSITTSQALAGAVFQGTATLDAALFAFAKSLIAAVDASNDPASVDITTGWPATFAGA